MRLVNVSCRDGFTDTSRFQTRWLENLDGIGLALDRRIPVGLRRWDAGFADSNLGPRYVLGEARYAARNALVCVHGFNSDVGRAERRYFQLAEQIYTPRVFDTQMLEPFFELVVGFYWPGAWSSGVGWVRANWNVEEAALRLWRLIKVMNDLGYLVRVSAHSLGCRVVHAAMQSTRTVEQVVFAAPAIPNNMPLTHGWRNSQNLKTRLHIAYSRDDKTLGRLYRIFNPFRPAMGYSGPTKEAYESQTNVYNHDYTGLVTDHGGYVENPSFPHTFTR